MDVDARVEALEAENERLRDELEALQESLGMHFCAPVHWRLTGKETKVLGRLLRGGPVSKDSLMAALYRDDGKDEPEIKIVDVFICKLRKKIRPFDMSITTIWGLGWQMEPTSIAAYRAKYTDRAAA